MINKVLLAILLLWPSLTFATETPDLDVDSLISDVRYEYEISPDIPWMCLGSLSVSFDIPEGTEKLYFYFTRYQWNPPRIFNRIPVDIAGKSSVNVTVDYIMPHAFFSALFYINGQAYRMSNYSVKDYISPEDLEYLEKLQSQNEVEEVSMEEPIMEITDRTVSIRCDSILHLTINTVEGKNIFNKKIDRYAEIPLNPGIFILTYVDNKNSYTKKIMIK